MPTITIDLEKCTGCESCVDVCPNGVLAVENEKCKVVEADECAACMSCVEACEFEAIKVEE